MMTSGSVAGFCSAALPVAAVLAIGLAPAHARSGGVPSCDDLWYERNALYKAGGYCFRTARAIQTFGNAGCGYDSTDDVPLSANDRRRIDDLQRIERRQGCPRSRRASSRATACALTLTKRVQHGRPEPHLHAQR